MQNKLKISRNYMLVGISDTSFLLAAMVLLVHLYTIVSFLYS